MKKMMYAVLGLLFLTPAVLMAQEQREILTTDPAVVRQLDSLRKVLDGARYPEQIHGEHGMILSGVDEAVHDAVEKLTTLDNRILKATMTSAILSLPLYDLDGKAYVQVVSECLTGLPSVKTMDAFGELLISLSEKIFETRYIQLGERGEQRALEDVQKMFVGPYYLGETGEEVSLAELSNRVQAANPHHPLPYAELFDGMTLESEAEYFE